LKIKFRWFMPLWQRAICRIKKRIFVVQIIEERAQNILL